MVKKPGIANYPELHQFMRLYWNPGMVDFASGFRLFCEDAASTARTLPLVKKVVEQMKEVEALGFARDKMPHMQWIEFWGRGERRLVPEDVQLAVSISQDLGR